MHNRRGLMSRVLRLIGPILLLAWGPVLAATPQAGDVLPEVILGPAASEADAVALGVAPDKPFKLTDVDADHVLVEVIGVYCPICLKQAPLMDRLAKRIAGDKKLSGRVKLLGLAAGATPEELDFLKQKKTYAFPVVNDPEYAAHKVLGEPKTPFLFLIDKTGKVKLVHLGVIDDVNAFFKEISAQAAP